MKFKPEHFYNVKRTAYSFKVWEKVAASGGKQKALEANITCLTF